MSPMHVDKHRISLEIYNAHEEKDGSKGSCFHEDNRKDVVLESQLFCHSCAWPTIEEAVTVMLGTYFVQH